MFSFKKKNNIGTYHILGVLKENTFLIITNQYSIV